MAIKYPPKPWVDEQRAFLIKGVEFLYNRALNKWVPITPGYSSNKQIQEVFGDASLLDLIERINKNTADIQNLSDNLDDNGKIWKTINKPQTPNENDIWIDLNTGKTFTYVITTQAWVEIGAGIQ